MKIYTCKVTEFSHGDGTITIKIPDELCLNGLGDVFIVDTQNILKKDDIL